MTWSSRIRDGLPLGLLRAAGRLGIPLLSLAITACSPSATSPPSSSPGPGARPTLSLPPQAAGPASAPAGPQGLLPLPAPVQVARSLPIGRFDPFAPLAGGRSRGAAASGGSGRPPVAAAAAARRRAGAGQFCPDLPPDFRFTGVIRGGGQVHAMVEAGGLSGSLRVGDRGGRSTDLLPLCWRVEAVDVNRGLLQLRLGRRLAQFEL